MGVVFEAISGVLRAWQPPLSPHATLSEEFAEQLLSVQNKNRVGVRVYHSEALRHPPAFKVLQCLPVSVKPASRSARKDWTKDLLSYFVLGVHQTNETKRLRIAKNLNNNGRGPVP